MEGLGHGRIIARGGRHHVVLACAGAGPVAATLARALALRKEWAKKGAERPPTFGPGIPDVRATSPVPILVGAPDALPRRVQGR
jgi:hypothetical protein